MIENCCICGKKVETIFKLPCIYPDNIGHYTQHIGICESCGLAFTQNPFTAQQLEDRYKNNSKYEYDSDDYYNIDIDEAYAKRCIRQKNFIDSNIDGDYSTILEIGAASGYNLSLYKDKEVLGVEPSKKNCILANKNYNVNMYNGMFSEYINENNCQKYDLIFLSHTLEHIVNPYEFIKQCRSICNKYIFIEVPTIDCQLVDELFAIFSDEHVNYFSLEGLTNMMNSLNFQLISSNIIHHSNVQIQLGYSVMSTLWKKTDENINKSIFIQSSKNLFQYYINSNNNKLPKIQSLINNIDDNEKLAIWGVGNHLAKLLANTDLCKKNIVKFYDSDVHKHSSTVFNKPIASFDESDIFEKRIDSILVATYSAQKTICKILDKHKNNCKIYCLYDLWS